MTRLPDGYPSETSASGTSLCGPRGTKSVMENSSTLRLSSGVRWGGGGIWNQTFNLICAVSSTTQPRRELQYYQYNNDPPTRAGKLGTVAVDSQVQDSILRLGSCNLGAVREASGLTLRGKACCSPLTMLHVSESSKAISGEGKPWADRISWESGDQFIAHTWVVRQ